MTKAAKQGIQAFNRECNRPTRMEYRMPQFDIVPFDLTRREPVDLEFGDTKSNLLDAANKVNGL